MKIYTSKELPMERYHSEEFPQASGSILAAIHADCPAAWKYGEPKETDAMSMGTVAHAMLLEPEEFDKRFVRGLSESDYLSALFTNKDLAAWLVNAGIKGSSGKTKEELIAMIDATGEQPPIWDRMVKNFTDFSEAQGLEVVPAKTYDTVQKMREVIFNNGYGELLSGGDTEVSLVNDHMGLKCRLDFVGDSVIVDYKTTSSAHPDNFGAQALRMNYWLKMALQQDLYAAHFGEFPVMILLAQSTKPPFIAQAYEMTEEQLSIGREQYQQAKALLDRCKEAGVYPAYGGGVRQLETPGWAARQFGFEMDDSIEIITSYGVINQ